MFSLMPHDVDLRLVSSQVSYFVWSTRDCSSSLNGSEQQRFCFWCLGPSLFSPTSFFVFKCFVASSY
ncbi:hypothetical protein AXX17_AT1G37750 [Arabidopsis thaliana]|uniref:Uncharacterized protein n=1 Tax=Arabidopsis thaliana TaxID=3702 RepID=A0A178W609_ARATH|nr:hypothetical protein AXX17_AT1G37750 [Arabidopsis thaliana]